MKKRSKSSLKKKRPLDISLQHKNEASYKFSKKNFSTWSILGLALQRVKCYISLPYSILFFQGVVNASISHMKRTKGKLEYRGIEYGHRRLDPTRGVDYLLSLIFRDNTSGQTVTRK